jgi:hypothetical protein
MNKLLSVSVGIGLIMATMAPARASLIHTESVGQVMPEGASTFGPVGPDCSATSGGKGCAFTSGSFTSTSKTDPFGPSTGTGTSTFFFGVNGANVTLSGAHDASGHPTGFCAPRFTTITDTYNDGSTLSQNVQATQCCAGDNCLSAGAPFGPPIVENSAGIITGGTGRFAGATGATSGSVSFLPGADGVEHSEGVLQLPDKPRGDD